jgi:8-oxo-dGTP pyrophosphatase MutT (NUDIX family)
LPGGGIEFGETPENALKRELLEEAALTAGRLELLTIATSTGKYTQAGEWYAFHHVGIIYTVSDVAVVSSVTPEEEERWFALTSLHQDDVTPFAWLFGTSKLTSIS